MKVIFLDRDGVLNRNRPEHVRCWEEFTFLPGVLDSLRWLHQEGWRTFVITNQAIVGRGLVPASAVDEIHQRMTEEIVRHGGRLDGLFYCPHRARDGCGCRKPQPGMLLAAARRFDIDLSQSFLVGDAWSDIEAGRAVGCRGVLVRTGRGRQQLALPRAQRFGDCPVVADLPAAIRWIDANERCPTLSNGSSHEQHSHEGRQPADPARAIGSGAAPALREPAGQ